MKKGKYAIVLIISFLGLFIISLKNSNDKIAYNISSHVYKINSKDHKAKYPVIKNLTDKKIEKKVNAIIKSYATEKWKKEFLLTADVGYNIDFEIKRQDEILSIKYYGWYWVTDGGPANNVVYTVNIDMKNGEQIDVKKIYFDKKGRKELLSNKFAVVDFKDTYNEFLAVNDIKSIIQQLEKSSVDRDIFYITEKDNIGAIIWHYDDYFTIEFKIRR